MDIVGRSYSEDLVDEDEETAEDGVNLPLIEAKRELKKKMQERAQIIFSEGILPKIEEKV